MVSDISTAWVKKWCMQCCKSKNPKPFRDQNPKKCVREESHPATEHWALASVTDWKRATAPPQCPQVRLNRPKRKEGGVSGHKKPSPVSACSVEHSGLLLFLLHTGVCGVHRDFCCTESVTKTGSYVKTGNKFLADLCYLTCMCPKRTF